MKCFLIVILFVLIFSTTVFGFPFLSSSSNTSSTTQRPPTNVSILSMTPDVNHALTIDHQNTVINMGQSLSMGITNAITRPLTFINNLIGSAAGSLPGLFAANGAALGTAIATPIQLGTLAANAAISGITGTLVSIPISMASGGAAQLVGLVGTGRQLWHSTLGSDPASSPFWQSGELWLQPMALVTGANSIMAGISLNALSQGVKNLGLGIERFGITLTDTGKNAKHLGSILIGWANGQPVYAPVINDTKTNEISVDLSNLLKLQQQKSIKVMANIDLDKIRIPIIDAANQTDISTLESTDSKEKTIITTTEIPTKEIEKKLFETTIFSTPSTVTTTITTTAPVTTTTTENPKLLENMKLKKQNIAV